MRSTQRGMRAKDLPLDTVAMVEAYARWETAVGGRRRTGEASHSLPRKTGDRLDRARPAQVLTVKPTRPVFHREADRPCPAAPRQRQTARPHRLLNLDLAILRRRDLGRRDRHFEHAVLERRVDLLRLHTIR